jgi:hypothetical protein
MKVRVYLHGGFYILSDIVVSPHLTWRVEIILKHWIPTGTTTTTTTTCALPCHGGCFCLISIDCWFYDFLLRDQFSNFFLSNFFFHTRPASHPSVGRVAHIALSVLLYGSKILLPPFRKKRDFEPFFLFKKKRDI